MKKHNIIIIIIGMALVLASGTLFLCEYFGFFGAGYDPSAVTASLVERFGPRDVRPDGGFGSLVSDTMPVCEIGGVDTLGLIEVRDHSLAVLSSHYNSARDYRRLACHHSGSVGTSDLTLVSGKPFEFLSTVDVGDPVTFTIATGEKYTYKVCEVHHPSVLKLDALDSKYSASLVLVYKKAGANIVVMCE